MKETKKSIIKQITYDIEFWWQNAKKIPTGVEQLVGCVILFFVVNLVFAYILTCQNCDQAKFAEAFFSLVANDFPEGTGVIVKAVDTVLDIVIVAILGGYIFSFLMSLHPGLVLPDNMVLRYSPQDTTEKEVLSILIGNKSRRFIVDLSCEITCVFHKDDSKSTSKVHTQMIGRRNVSSVNNFFRFSFDAADIPVKFWENYRVEKGLLKKHESSTGDQEKSDEAPISQVKNFKDDHITVLLSGASNFLGGRFYVMKEYAMSNIQISTALPEDSIYKKSLDEADEDEKSNERQVVDWKKFKEWPSEIIRDENGKELSDKDFLETLIDKINSSANVKQKSADPIAASPERSQAESALAAVDEADTTEQRKG